MVLFLSLYDQSDKHPALTGWGIIPYGWQQIPLIFLIHSLLTGHKCPHTVLHTESNTFTNTCWQTKTQRKKETTKSHNMFNKSSGNLLTKLYSKGSMGNMLFPSKTIPSVIFIVKTYSKQICKTALCLMLELRRKTANFREQINKTENNTIPQTKNKKTHTRRIKTHKKTQKTAINTKTQTNFPLCISSCCAFVETLTWFHLLSLRDL